MATLDPKTKQAILAGALTAKKLLDTQLENISNIDDSGSDDLTNFKNSASEGLKQTRELISSIEDLAKLY